MHCEERGHRQAAAAPACEREQHEKEQGGVQRVQREVAGVVSGGIEPEQLDVEHV